MFWTKKCEDGRHRFEPRYDTTMPPIKAEGISLAAIEAIMNRRYVYDICVKCGKTVIREGSVE